MMAERLAAIASDLNLPARFQSVIRQGQSLLGRYLPRPGTHRRPPYPRPDKKRTGLPILTDVHDVSQVAPVAEVCDVLQIPAFLSRQTDLLVAVGRSGRVANIKKGQFLSPADIANAAEKVASTGNQKIILTERGASFGYQNLVVDMRAFPIMRKLGYPVVYDVTRSVRLPGGEGKSSGGQPEFIEPLARAGTAVGVDGLFLEVHDNPAKALSDGTNALALDKTAPSARKNPEARRTFSLVGARIGSRKCGRRQAWRGRQRFLPMNPAASSIKAALETAKRVLRIEAEAIADLATRLDARFEKAVELLYVCKGRIVVTGLGKSGLIARKIAATFSSTGTPSLFLHAAEALHGDLGMLTAGDVVVAISTSGETEELIGLLETVKRLGIPLITLTAKPRSTLAAASDIVLDIGVKEEACSLNLAPTASTAAAMAMGDALAIALLERRGFQEDDFAALHPGGLLGKKLRRVESLMHSGDDLPRVLAAAKMPDVIYEMSCKGLGLTAVTEPGGKLLGIVTDGDLRRLMQQRKESVLDLTAGDCDKKSCHAGATELAAAAPAA